MKEIVKIIRYSGKLWPYYAAVGFLVSVVSLLNLAQPFLIKSIIDALGAGLTGHPVNLNHLEFIVGAILAAGLSAALLDNINGYIGDVLSVKLTTLLSRGYYDHILGLPLDYYDNQVTGKITSQLDRGISTMSDLIQSLSNNFLQFALTAVFTLVAIAFYSWPVALILTILFPLYIWITRLSSEAWIKHQEGINQDTDYAKGRFIEAIGQIRVVKSFVQESAESRIFAGRRDSIERQTKVQSRQWHRYDVYRRFALNILFCIIYGLIAWQAWRHTLTIGQTVLLIQLVAQAQWPLFGSSWIIGAIQRAQAGTRDFFAIMETKPTIQDHPDAKKLEVSEAQIEFNNVKFNYHSGQDVLKGISFTVEPGSKVALIGESGEGKTTISNLLLRFYDTTGGEILIDGQPIKSVTQASLRSHIGVVFQDPALFSGTIKENILYGSGKSSKEDMIRAATAANAHDFIMKLPKGYNTEIGERGVKLSGGQKQRVAIARAIMKNPPILVLDEATSSLDSKAEREVQDALEHLMEERTTLIIAHRLSTIANVDTIVAIKGGQIAEMGAPFKLAKSGGIYAELLSLQTPSKTNTAKLKKYELARG